jgi:hypothetical protein
MATKTKLARPKSPTTLVVNDYAALSLDLYAHHQTIALTQLALVGAVAQIELHTVSAHDVAAFVEPVTTALEGLFQSTARLHERSVAIGAALCAATCRK